MQKRERNFPRATLQRSFKKFAAIFFVVRSELRDICVDFLAIEAAVANCEKLRSVASLNRRDRDAIQIARIVKAGVIQKFRVLRIDLLWLRHPIAERRKKWRSAKLRDIREDHRVRVGGDQRERAFSLVACAAGKIMMQRERDNGDKRESDNQANPNASIHVNFIFLQSLGNW